MNRGYANWKRTIALTGRLLVLLISVSGVRAFSETNTDEAIRESFVDRMTVDPLNEDSRASVQYHMGRMRSLGLAPEEIPAPALNPPSRDSMPAQAQDRGKAKIHTDQANRFLAAGEPSKALLEMRDALTYVPNDLAVLRPAATLATSLKKYLLAETFSRLYLAQKPDDVQILGLRALVLLRMSRMEEAKATVARALAIDPDDAYSRLIEMQLLVLREDRALSSTYWRQRRFEQMAGVAGLLVSNREELQAALGADDFQLICDTTLGEGTTPHLDRILELHQRILDPAREDQYQEQLDNLLELKQLGVRGFGLSTIEAELLRRLGRAADARQAWDSIRTQFSDYPDALLNFGRHTILSGDYPAAVASLRSCLLLLKNKDTGLTEFLLATALSLQGQTGEAQLLYNKIIRSHCIPFQSWIKIDPLFQDALDRMPNAKALLRLLEIPPESE